MFNAGTKSFSALLACLARVSFINKHFGCSSCSNMDKSEAGATFLARMSTISMQIFNEKEFSDLFLTYHRLVSRAAP